MLYSLELGDWSGDGHGISRTFRIDVNYPFEDLQDNYLKNTEKYGFGIDDLARGFEDSHFPREYYEAIAADGFKFSENVDSYELVDGEYYLFEDGVIEVAMFLLGNGLSGFRWSFVPDNSIRLFGGGKLKGRKGYPVSAGYGLYTP